MNLLPETSEATDSAGPRAATRVRTAEPEHIQMKKFMGLLGKMCLNNALHNRILRAIVIDCYRVSVENPYIEAHMEATAKYAVAAKKMRDAGKSQEEVKEELGIPSVHGFNAMVKVYIDTTPGLPLVKEVQEAVALWTSQEGWKTINKSIRHCRVSRMFKSAHKRLEISVPAIGTSVDPSPPQAAPPSVDGLSPAWVWTLILHQISKDEEFLTQEEMAPAGDLERQIQAMVDSFAQK